MSEPQPTIREPAPARAAPAVIHLPDQRQHGRKKVTSGSNKRQRRHLERFRTDDAEHAALHEQLRATGLSLGAYVMRLAAIEGGNVSRARRRGHAPVDVVALTQALVAFNRAGNNQNQTARALNELVLIAREQGCDRLEKQVRDIAAAVRAGPDLFAAPVAAIMAALNRDREG
jgi:Mobilization protein NikA